MFLDDGFDFPPAVLRDERGEFVNRQAGLIPFDDLGFRFFLHLTLTFTGVYLL